jgi:glycerophosphoryl diester phosphodiesterase
MQIPFNKLRRIFISIVLLALILSVFLAANLSQAALSVVPTSLPTFLQTSLPSIQDRLRNHKLVAGHQGGIYDGTPNTLDLFKQAAKNGIDILEMDLRLSKDGIPVVYHDEDLNRMTNCAGAVANMNLADLKKCEFKFFFKGGRITSFEEVLKWNQNRVILNAEFKIPEVVAPTLALVKKYQAYSSVYFQTKNEKNLYLKARALSAEVPLLFAPGNQEALDWALGLLDPQLVVIELHENIRTPENILKIHQSGKWASENSWHWRYDGEFVGVSCYKGFKEFNLDILVSNRPQWCAKEKPLGLRRGS